MTNTFKSVSLNPLPSGADILYTMPELTSGLLLSAIAATTNIGTTRQGSLGILRAVALDVDWLSSNIAIASSSSVNLLAGKVALSSGDMIVGNQGDNASTGQQTLSTGSHPYTGDPILLLSNADGSIIVAVCNTGIFCSTDSGNSATRATTETLTAKIGMFFSGAFHVYTSATSKRTSTDGVTWTTVACTNAPISPVNLLGDIIVKGGAAFGKSTAMQMVTSSDGITWTNYGVTLPVACSSLCWTGTNFVAGNTANNGNIYWSTNASAWTAVAGLASTTVTSRGIAAVGSTVMVNFSATLYVSTDHGLTLSSAGQGAVSNYPVLSTGSAFLSATSTTQDITTAPGYPGAWKASQSPFAQDIASGRAFVIAGQRLISARSHSLDLNLSLRGGMTITASILEITA